LTDEHGRPTEIRVGPYDYAVVWDAEATKRHTKGLPAAAADGTYAGVASHWRAEIAIDPEPPLCVLRTTLLHEVLHCVWRVAELPEKKLKDEPVVSALTPTLLDTLQRNPHLRAFLFPE